MIEAWHRFILGEYHRHPIGENDAATLLGMTSLYVVAFWFIAHVVYEVFRRP